MSRKVSKKQKTAFVAATPALPWTPEVVEIEDTANGTRFRLLASGYIALMAVTWRLWIPQQWFPQVPLSSGFIGLPRLLEWIVLALLISALLGMLFVTVNKYRRLASLIAGVTTLGLVCFDQHRLQPWAWQFIVLSLVLFLASAEHAYQMWRWLVIGIYAWSAWSKVDYGFCQEHGPFLLEGLFKSIGLSGWTQSWSAKSWSTAAGTIPVFELLVAVGLVWKRTRRIAAISSFGMHIVLLLALGPFGHNHRPGVLFWNLFFLIQNLILFLGTSNRQQPQKAVRAPQTNTNGDRLAMWFVIAVLAWPSLEPVGLCDHWPSWAVYAAKPERVTFFVDEEELSKLPSELEPYLGPAQETHSWRPVRIDRWSLDTVFVPIYPQDRFQVGVSLGIVGRFDLQRVRLMIEEPANRTTGERKIRTYVGPHGLQNLANSFRLNARPRY